MPAYLTFILRPLVFYFVTLVLFLIQKYLFILFYPEIFRGLSVSDRMEALWHGIGMDASMAGYVTILPLLLSMFAVWLPERRSVTQYRVVDGPLVVVGSRDALPWKRHMRRGVIIYSLLIAIILSGIAILDASLYPAWGFKLDTTPFYYFFSAPGTVIKSLSTSQVVGGLLAIFGVSVVWFCAYFFTWCQIHFQPIIRPRVKLLTFIVLVIMGVILGITIRGGVTVSTMNLSRAYFSSDQRMNHAAINPAFSLLNATMRKSTNLDKYTVYPTSELPDLLSAIAPVSTSYEGTWTGADSIVHTHRPDIYIIILESFSSHLLPSLGGENIAPNIDKEAQEGLLFTNAYANTFRTDRALPAILRAFPGIPDVGLTKDIKNLERTPSLASALERVGYNTEYYYGGDINFTNMQAFLVSGGFKTIVCDNDFPISQRLGKWGVHDHNLFERIKQQTSRQRHAQPLLRVIQTSSSHEPFEVPFKKLSNPAANAFAYTDSVVGDYMRHLRRTGDWDNALVILVPDHYGAYPEPSGLSEQQRHQIPIIFTGGAMKAKGNDDTPMTQADIAPTVLGLLNVNHDQFFFGHNVFDEREPKVIFYYEPEWAYMETATGKARLNVQTMETEEQVFSGKETEELTPADPSTQLLAWLQALASIYINE